jgi:predicted phage terminase large subunit-like protein
MKIAPEYAVTIAAEFSRHRRESAAKSPELFARVYLDHAFERPPCRLHAELNTELVRMTTRRGSHLAVAAPRGHAKSTIVSLAYILWCLLYKKEEFVLLVSATGEQADKLLDHVKRQLETNGMLRADFPDLGRAKSITPWRKNSILIPGAGMLMSYSAGQNMRGARHGKSRPTLIVADDLEDKLQVASEEQRGKLQDWFTSTLLKAGTPSTNVVVVGTVLHHDSLLANLLNPAAAPGWQRLEYRAIERATDHPELWQRWEEIYRGEVKHEDLDPMDGADAYYRLHQQEMDRGAQVLWKGLYSYQDLMKIRIREGESSFQAEYQNQPLDPAHCIFSRAPFMYWNTTFATAQELIQSLKGHGEFYGACDPGLGGNLTHGDYSAILIIYKHWPTKKKYVIVADLARRNPSDTIARIVEYCKVYEFRSFVLESNQFQRLMFDDLLRQVRGAGLDTKIYPIESKTSKLQRIASLEPQVSQGQVVFNSTHELLMEQLRAFPLAKHDDGPDALQMAVADSDLFSYGLYDPDRPRGLIGSVGGKTW